MSRGPSPGRRFRIGWIAALAVVAILGGLWRPDPMARRIDLLRARGEPVSIGDLARGFPAGPEEERRRLLGALAQVRHAFTGFDAVDLSAMGSLRAVDWGPDALASWAAAQPVLAPALEDLRAALDDRAKPLGVVADGTGALVSPRAPDFQCGALALRLDAQAALARGEQRAALDAVSRQIRMAGRIPIVDGHSWQARDRVEVEMFRTLADLLGSARLAATDWRELRRALGSLEDPAADVRALRGERAVDLAAWERSPEGGPASFGRDPSSAGGWVGVLRRLDERTGGLRRARVRHLDLMEAAITAASLGGRERTTAERALLARASRGWGWGLGHRGADSFRESLGDRFDRMARRRSRFALLRLATALAEWRSLTGRPPDSLGQLRELPGDPAPVMDPVGERPIRYLPGPNGFRLVAPGRDAVDEDGAGDDLVVEFVDRIGAGGGGS